MNRAARRAAAKRAGKKGFAVATGAVLASGGLAAIAAPPAAADEPIVVTSTEDYDPEVDEPVEGTLRAAIEEANTGEADPDIIVIDTDGTILLQSQITITDRLTIQGAGDGQPRIRSDYVDDGTRIFYLEAGADGSVLEDLELLYGDASGYDPDDLIDPRSPNGGAIFSNGASLTLDDVEIRYGEAEHGGAVFVDGANLIVTDSELYDNDASSSGGAIAVVGGGDLTVTYSDLYGNDAGLNGGSIEFSDGGTVAISETAIRNGSASGAGGGGVWIDGADSASIDGVHFVELNAEFGDGGAISVADVAALSVTGSEFSGNEAASAGGAITVDDVAVVRVTGSYFDENYAESSGGGISFVGGGELHVIQSEFDGNVAIPRDPGQTYGGAISFEGVEGNGVVDITQSEIGDGFAERGGGVWIDGAASATIDATEFDELSAKYDGGAISVVDVVDLSIANTVVTGSQVAGERYDVELEEVVETGQGGAVSLVGVGDSDAPAVIANSTFLANDAGVDGGGIWADGSSLRLENVSLLENQAGNSGGGLALYDSVVEMVHGTVAFNEASYGEGEGLGGGIAFIAASAAGASNLDLTNSIIANNTNDESPNDLDTIDVDFATVSTDQALLTSVLTNVDLPDDGVLYEDSFELDRVDTESPWIPVALPADPDGDGDLTAEDSPAVDAGVATGIETDARGIVLRTIGSAPDLGAAELQLAGPSATFTVDSTGDGVATATTLRRALLAANGTWAADTINVTVGGVEVSSDLPEVVAPVTINGGGATIDGGGEHQLFTTFPGDGAEEGMPVTLSAMTLTSGGADIGPDGELVGSPDEWDWAGAVDARGVALSLTDVNVHDSNGILGGAVAFAGDSLTITGGTFSGNTSLFDGGAVTVKYAQSATITGATISGNTADNWGGGVAIKYAISAEIRDTTIAGNTSGDDGGGILAGAIELSIVQTTISGNASGDNGGGLFVRSDGDPVSIANVLHSTVTGNTADDAVAGVYAGAYSGVVAEHSVIAANVGTDVGSGFDASFEASWSAIDEDSAELVSDETNVLTDDPMLGELADNGGLTLTHVPLEGSPLIDAGDPDLTADDVPELDQRGAARIVGGRIDVGSVEWHAAPPPVTTPPDGGGAAPTTSTTAPAAPPAIDEDDEVIPPDRHVETADGEATVIAPSDDLDTGEVEVVQVDVQVDGGVVSVVIETAEGEEPTTVIVTSVDTEDIDENTSGFRLLDAAYEVEVTGGADGKPATVCFPYDATEVADAGMSEADLTVFHFNDAGEREALPTTVDTANGRVCATVTSFSPFAIGVLETTRLAGTTAAATAAAISESAFDPGVPVAYLVARGPDGLGAGSAAAVAGGPVLLVDQNGVPDATAAELERLAPARIIVVGGSGVISDAVVTAVGGERVAGDDRYGTAAAASASAFTTSDTVYVASGLSMADALVAGAAAGGAGAPLLLVEPDAVPAATAAEIARLGATNIVVVGGTAAVSDGVVATLGATRLAGVDRYATAAAVAQALGLTNVFVARGDDPVDAAAGIPAAAVAQAAIVLVLTDEVPTSVDDVLTALDTSAITVLGGTGAISRQTEVDLAEHLD